MQLSLILYIKCDETTRECIYQDLVSYFEKVHEVETNWDKYKDNFEFKFWFQKILLRKTHVRNLVSDGEISQTGVMTYNEFTQKNEAHLTSELKKAQNESGDSRIIEVTRLKVYIYYSSFLAQVILKILLIEDFEKKDIISKSKEIMNRLLNLTEI